MILYYMETSALLKRYRTEPGSDVIVELLERRRPDETFITSYFTLLEVEATAARALKARLLDQGAYGAFLGRFALDAGGFLVFQPVTNDTVRQAAEVTRRYALRGADALHLATVILGSRNVVEATETVIVTSDRELCAAAEADGWQVLNPQVAQAEALLNTLRATTG